MKTILNWMTIRPIALQLICVPFLLIMFCVSDATAQTTDADLTVSASPANVVNDQQVIAEKIGELEQQNAMQQESINFLEKQVKNLSANLMFMENNYQKQLADLQRRLAKVETSASVVPQGVSK